MILFTNQIIQDLTAQYDRGSALETQNIICKIFNPYGAGTWYCLNMDPADEDYIWCIAHITEWETGSVLRSELETLLVPPFGLPLERDLSFQPMNAKTAFDRLITGQSLYSSHASKEG
ncbi:DUF2958 domain-containing protein [Tunicatimonas pelagia]|uniref:DUF2958 domain-containing protein n=1 Tax=Tunicatimonas pelagia TaxID=931531 RepID=UPI0026650CE0|nr:DUF2958 domain-containing protein [Tunicatimonas pelagia]WKN45381.1 DUF2958 domain-containing protein [Tunicatimonas pelagia]